MFKKRISEKTRQIEEKSDHLCGKTPPLWRRNRHFDGKSPKTAEKVINVAKLFLVFFSEALGKEVQKSAQGGSPLPLCAYVRVQL